MTQDSFLWTTGGAGDGSATFTRADWSNILKIVAACMDEEGVAPAFLNLLAPSGNGANSVRVATGGALVDGKPYLNDANVDTNIPSAVGGGNTRIDRLVLRADWTAQTVRITRIAGTDAATPTAPAITTTSGTTYDVPLCQVLVNTAGAVTVTDERVFAKPGAATVDSAALRNSAALSVIGRSANSAGVPADIAAASDGEVLRRSGTAIGFGLLADANITPGGLTNASLANRTRTFLVPVIRAYNSTAGADVPVDTAGTGLGIHPFSATDFVTMFAEPFRVPTDFVSGMTIDVVYQAQSAGSNLRGAQTVIYGAVGEGRSTGGTDTFAEATIANPGSGLIGLIAQVALSAVAIGDYVSARFYRDGANVNDSMGAAGCIGFLVSYTADH